MSASMGRFRLATLAVPAVAALAVALVAFAGAGAAASNTVKAGLSYGGSHAKARLTISVGGQTLYDQPVRSSLCKSSCTPVAVPPGKSPLHVLDLESNGQPDVVLGLYSGGAHCCYTDQVFSLDPGTRTYVKSEHDFLDAGATIKQIGGHYQFFSANIGPFEYRFTDYADSGAPIQIWEFSGRRFHDVTRQFPNRIKADAAQWLHAFKHNYSNGEGLIAAWAADEDLLGNSKLVRATLATQLRQGHLHSLLSPTDPTGKKFVTALQKLLKRLGYTR
jgi:hypothetical protein